MVSDGYTHWVIVQVVANTLVGVAPLAGAETVRVAPTVKEAVRVLCSGEVAAFPLIGDNLQVLRGVLQRCGVVV